MKDLIGPQHSGSPFDLVRRSSQSRKIACIQSCAGFDQKFRRTVLIQIDHLTQQIQIVVNLLHQSIAIDFAVVPTLRFSLLYVCVILDHGRRRILHVNVTTNPTAAWAAQQIVEALPWETNVQFLFRDGDGIYGEEFERRVAGLSLRQIVTARASPWQNAYCERVIGTLRRECLDHVVAVNERQLKGVLDGYVRYYNGTRTHLSLAKNSPISRRPSSKRDGTIVALPEAGGLHHRYERIAA